MTAPLAAASRPDPDLDLARAFEEWRAAAARQWLLARGYADALAAESDALVAVATLSHAGAPTGEIAQARVVLARAMAVRDTAGRRLRVPAGLPVSAARAAENLLHIARLTRAEVAS